VIQIISLCKNRGNGLGDTHGSVRLVVVTAVDEVINVERAPGTFIGGNRLSHKAEVGSALQ
jgi:hypothetical protein